LPVESGEGSFSGRPRPAGQTDSTREEVAAFARFARRRLLAMTYEEPDRIVFVPVWMGREFRYLFTREPEYGDETWIAFGDDGRVTVNISEADYLLYRDDLDFDRLCRSLADLFIEFLELHRSGRSRRIVDRLDAMKVGLFS
jgi:hypothetical protein